MTAVVTGGSPQVFINGLEAARKSDTTDGVTEADATSIATSVAGSVVSSTLSDMQQAIAWGSATLNSVNGVFQMTAPLTVPAFSGSLPGANNTVPTIDLVQRMITNGEIIFPITVAEGGTGANNEASARTNLGLATVANTGSYDDLSNIPFILDGANNISFARASSVIYSTNSFALSSNGKYNIWFYSNGAVSALGTFTANNFSGNSSGINTGDQVIPTTLPPSGNAGGVLTGTYPNPTANASYVYSSISSNGITVQNGGNIGYTVFSGDTNKSCTWYCNATAGYSVWNAQLDYGNATLFQWQANGSPVMSLGQIALTTNTYILSAPIGALIPGNDANNIAMNGLYWCDISSSNVSLRTLNVPAGAPPYGGITAVLPSTTRNVGSQIYTSTTPGSVPYTWIRSTSSYAALPNTWGPWYQIVTSAMPDGSGIAWSGGANLGGAGNAVWVNSMQVNNSVYFPNAGNTSWSTASTPNFGGLAICTNLVNPLGEVDFINGNGGAQGYGFNFYSRSAAGALNSIASLGYSNTVFNANVSFVGANVIFSGSTQINLPSYAGYAFISKGNADQATLTQYDISFNSWWGIGFPTYSGTNYATLDTRTGSWILAGSVTANALYSNYNTTTWPVTTGGIAYGGGDFGLVCHANNNGGSSATSCAAMTFIRDNVFGCYFGLDTDNYLKIGGWSFGNNAYRIIHEGLSQWSCPSGINFVNQVAGSVTDLSKHINLYGGQFGFNITNNTLGYVVPTGSSHYFTVNGAAVANINATLTTFYSPVTINQTVSIGQCVMNGSDGWFRSIANAGWYSSTWGIGIYCTDSTYVRTYNNAKMAANDFVISSDITLKENITDFEYRGPLHPKSFNWKSNKEHDIGFIAQEVEKTYPEAVGVLTQDDGAEIKQLSYQKLSVVLAAQLNELTKKVDHLESQVKYLMEKCNGNE